MIAKGFVASQHHARPTSLNSAAEFDRAIRLAKFDLLLQMQMKFDMVPVPGQQAR
jgi:hypothetical protein